MRRPSSGWRVRKVGAAVVAQRKGLAQAERGVADDAAPMGGKAGRRRTPQPSGQGASRSMATRLASSTTPSASNRASASSGVPSTRRVAVKAQQQEALRVGLDQAVLDDACRRVAARHWRGSASRAGERRCPRSRAGRRPGGRIGTAMPTRCAGWAAALRCPAGVTGRVRAGGGRARAPAAARRRALCARAAVSIRSRATRRPGCRRAARWWSGCRAGGGDLPWPAPTA